MPDMQIKVLDKAVQIIESVANSERGLRLSDITTSLSISKPTASRILRVLQSHNLVGRNGDATFVLGDRVLWWETCYRRNFALLGVVRPHLEKLRDLTGETTAFSVLTGFHTVVIDQAASPHVTSSRYDLGARTLLHIGSSGKAILAHLPVDKRKEFFSNRRSMRSAHGSTINRRLLEHKLASIKKAGVAITEGERYTDTASVAAPAFGREGQVIGAIAVVGPPERLKRNRLKWVVPIVLEEARLLSNRLSRGTSACPK
jgi:DNA-binding IclR family transcriptional regulator